MGDEKKAFMATHVGVFFIKGVYTNYEQPLFYYPLNIKGFELRDLFRTVITICTVELDLKVVITLVDQNATTCKAYRELGASVEKSYFIQIRQFHQSIVSYFIIK